MMDDGSRRKTKLFEDKRGRALEEALRLLPTALGDNALGRMHAMLTSARRSATFTQRVAAEPLESGEQAASRPMLPVHFPSVPRGLAPGGGKLRSRRRSARRRDRWAAWAITELTIAVLNLWVLDEAECRNWRKAMGPWGPSPTQAIGVDLMFEEILRFCRRASEARSPLAGRGMTTLREALIGYEKVARASTGDADFDLPHKNLATAKPVVADRIALPTRAAVVRPELHLPSPLREEYLDLAGRQRGRTDDVPVPRACLMIEPSEEGKLRKRLLDCGMARLVPESSIPLQAGGAPHACGLICRRP